MVFGSNASTEYFIGNLDELRISNSSRSAEWISTEYNNQNSPDTFYSLASEEVNVPTAPTSLYANNTDASAGSTNPTDLTSLTPVFSAICNSTGGNCLTAYIEVATNTNFTSPVWQSSAIDIADTVNGNRIADITYAGDQLNYNTTYYWHIKFTNTLGTGSWSDGLDYFYVPRSIELLNFNYGGTVQQGQRISINWLSYGGEDNETVRLEYSTDDFSTTSSISLSESSLSSTSTIRSYSWTIPSISSSNVKIKISSNNDGNNYSVTSSVPFTIQAGTADGIYLGQDFSNQNFYT